MLERRIGVEGSDHVVALLDGAVTAGPRSGSTDPAELERIRQFRQYIWHVWAQHLPLQDAEIAAGLTEADIEAARDEVDG